jgi:hypothetical protein
VGEEFLTAKAKKVEKTMTLLFVGFVRFVVKVTESFNITTNPTNGHERVHRAGGD